MSTGFLDKVNNLSKERIINISDRVNDLRDFIKVIANANLLVASSTGPLHLASALGVKTIGLHCHRPMSCIKRWGALSRNAINIEVSKEYCDKFCSEDKNICAIENGIDIDELTQIITREVLY